MPVEAECDRCRNAFDPVLITYHRDEHGGGYALCPSCVRLFTPETEPDEAFVLHCARAAFITYGFGGSRGEREEMWTRLTHFGRETFVRRWREYHQLVNQYERKAR